MGKNSGFVWTLFSVIYHNRGGVEDTRLEAKDTKNPRPRPRPRTVLPRTNLLEAKDKNARGQGQGPRTQAQVLSKKKKNVFRKIFQAISKKKFSGDLQKPVFQKIFSGALQTFNYSKNTAVLGPRTRQFSRT